MLAENILAAVVCWLDRVV